MRLGGRLVFAALLLAASPTHADEKSDAAIRKAIIAESRAEYSGSCACPYDTDRAGRSCGKRSAYSKPRGAAPLCFNSDVTSEMVAEYRARNSC